MILQVWDDSRGTGQCRSCHATITWYELVSSGKRMPFDGDEIVYVKTDTEGRRLVGHIDATINKSHFATCPEATTWRRK